MNTYFINRPNLDRLARSLSKAYRVYFPVQEEEDRFYKRLGDQGLEGASIGGIRPVQTIKSFYFPARIKVANYFPEKISGYLRKY